MMPIKVFIQHKSKMYHNLIFFRFSNTLYSEGKNGTTHIFRHPFLQTWGLSFGEFTCILISIAWSLFKTRNSNDESETATNNELEFSPFIFLPAAIFHQTSRCFISMALVFTTASSFQILSGSNLIFACIFSKIFLRETEITMHKWIGVFIILGKN